ncbi:DNA repair protein rad52 [Sporothrix bragantina]|uniref:DNA repair protein rad52 n=1 Tax=Sporothrix bragantina TaxID=671064 RepID=A0ABP0ANP0_9PEZI
MPAPGDQHQPVSNPFNQSMQPQQGFGDMNQQQQQQQPAQRMSEYTAQEIATLQSRLEKQLGPEYLSARAGPSGQKVHYIAAEKVITLANEVFGFNGWSSSIQNIQIDFVDEHPQTLKISVGLSVIVRVTLRDGTYHEDIGYGHIENCKGKAAAFEKAKKEGTTDALKRALRSFGNVLGNCIYDKKYVERVSKMKAVPVNKRPFTEQALHRHSDYVVKIEEGTTVAGPVAGVPHASAAAAPRLPEMGRAVVKSEPSTLPEPEFNSDLFDDDLLLGGIADFDEADFCVSNEGHPDEFVVRESSVPALPPPQQNQGFRSTSPLRQVQQQPQQNNGYNQSRLNGNSMAQRPPQTPMPMNNRPNLPGVNNQQGNRPPQQAPKPQNANGNGNDKPASFNTAINANGGAEVEGTPWLSARAVAKAGDDDALAVVAPSIQAGHLFNPKAESPSIRKTPGVDHNSSMPIKNSKLNRPIGSILTPSANAATNGNNVATANAGSPASAAPGGIATRSGVNHATSEPVRRIGAPPSSASPLANRNQFRPPPMKRGPPPDAPGAAPRPPLADMPSNVSTAGGTVVVAAATGASPVDAKRQKLA